jgi:hypothetical protein
VRSVFVNVPVFSPQSAAGRTTSASRAVSVRKASETTTKSPPARGSTGSGRRSGSDTAGFVPMTQRNSIEPCSA